MITLDATAPLSAGSQGPELVHNNIVSNIPARRTNFFVQRFYKCKFANAFLLWISGDKRYHFVGREPIFLSSHFPLLLPPMQASFSRGLDIVQLKVRLREFWRPRLSAVSRYVIPANDPGRPNGSDHGCIIMQLLRAHLDISISDALSVLKKMSEMPEYARHNWNVTYSTFRKRTEATALYKAYYDKIDINKVTWTTANQKYALSLPNWDTHMKMLAEVAVAVQAVYAKYKGIKFDAIEMACKALEILNTIPSASVQIKAPHKEKKSKKTEKKQKCKKRSRAAAERAMTSEPPIDVTPPARNLLPRKNKSYASDIDESIVIKLATAQRKPVKKSDTVRATAPAPAPPAPAPFVIDMIPSIVGFYREEVEKDSQSEMDRQLAQDSDDILCWFPDSLGLLLLDEWKVYEIEEPAAEAEQQNQTMPQLQFHDMQQTMEKLQQLQLP